jgi:hypothetical protein
MDNIVNLLGAAAVLGSVVAIAVLTMSDAFIEWKRHSWRFGLRAVLIVMTLFGGLLWLIFHSKK